MDDYKRILKNGIRYYGQHMIATAVSCNENLISKEYIADFLRQLVEKIDMAAFGQPIVERFGEGIEIGISAVQLIETSAITIHTNDKALDMYIDVFSCKDFSEETVISHIEASFSPIKIDSETFLRR